MSQLDRPGALVIKNEVGECELRKQGDNRFLTYWLFKKKIQRFEAPCIPRFP
jgi:hypothetical protein